MEDFGIHPSNTEAARRWSAERENATAQLDLARTWECCKLLVSQHEPVHSLGVSRMALKIMLDFVRHHDVNRLRRECEVHLSALELLDEG